VFRIKKGFTLLEIMTVISIIGILILALIPAYGLARRSSCRQVTHAWHEKVILAYESYWYEHAEYPHFGVESIYDDLAVYMDEFLDLLANGTNAEPYFRLSESDFRADWNGSKVPGDGFGNPHTVVLTDDDRDGKIWLNSDSRIPDNLYPDNRDYIYATVAVYSLNSDNNSDWEWVCSWK